MGNFFYKNEVDDFTFFKRAVGVFSSSFLEKEYCLTERQLELLYSIFRFKTKGSGDMFSMTNIKEFFPTFGSKRVLQVWLPQLAEKLWIRYENDIVEITQPTLLGFLSKDKLSFNIFYKRKQDGGI